jgi:hypothetical protein
MYVRQRTPVQLAVQDGLPGDCGKFVAPEQHPVPLASLVRRLMAEQDFTLRSLSARTRELDPRGKGLSHTYLGQLARGDEPTTWALELVAAALGFELPDVAEYRLAEARRRLDPKEVGLDASLEALEAVEAALPPPAGSGRRAPVPESLRRRAQGRSPSRGDRGEGRERGAA